MHPILDYLYKINCWTVTNPRLLEKCRINSLVRYSVGLITNIIVPLLYTIHPKKENYSTTVSIVVSLTSFPARINRVWIVIETMLRQNFRPEKIILWLSIDQFPNRYGDLSDQLTSLQSDFFEIRFVEGDIRSHKKYYYVFKDFPDKYILTIDDDLLFPSTFIQDLYNFALKNPNSVIANFGSKIRWNVDKNYIERIPGSIEIGRGGNDMFFGSGGGTLFPPGKIAGAIDEISTIMSICPTADDIYLNAIVHIVGLTITFMSVSPLLSLKNRNDKKLVSYNGDLYSPLSNNAIQLRALLEYLKDNGIENPFFMSQN